jgi:ribose 5-phosphate isomerase RpiB
MTADLLLAPPTVTTAPADDRVTCAECFDAFPAAETREHLPSERVLCLDDYDAELLREHDDREFFNYRRGC